MLDAVRLVQVMRPRARSRGHPGNRRRWLTFLPGLGPARRQDHERNPHHATESGAARTPVLIHHPVAQGLEQFVEPAARIWHLGPRVRLGVIRAATFNVRLPKYLDEPLIVERHLIQPRSVPLLSAALFPSPPVEADFSVR
jgi:hypothetical protein